MSAFTRAKRRQSAVFLRVAVKRARLRRASAEAARVTFLAAQVHHHVHPVALCIAGVAGAIVGWSRNPVAPLRLGRITPRARRLFVQIGGR